MAQLSPCLLSSLIIIWYTLELIGAVMKVIFSRSNSIYSPVCLFVCMSVYKIWKLVLEVSRFQQAAVERKEQTLEHSRTFKK